MDGIVIALIVLVILAGIGTGAYFLVKKYSHSDNSGPKSPGISTVTYFDASVAGKPVTIIFEPKMGHTQIATAPHGMVYVRQGDLVMPIGSYKLIHVSKQAGLVTYGIVSTSHTLKSLGMKGAAQDVLLTTKKAIITTTAGEEVVLTKRRTKL